MQLEHHSPIPKSLLSCVRVRCACAAVPSVSKDHSCSNLPVITKCVIHEGSICPPHLVPHDAIKAKQGTQAKPRCWFSRSSGVDHSKLPARDRTAKPAAHNRQSQIKSTEGHEKDPAHRNSVCTQDIDSAALPVAPRQNPPAATLLEDSRAKSNSTGEQVHISRTSHDAAAASSTTASVNTCPRVGRVTRAHVHVHPPV